MIDANPPSGNLRIDSELLQRAVEFRFDNPDANWAEVAQTVGRDPRTIYMWRQTEQWEITFRQVASRHADKLVPKAIAALMRAWAKGNPSGALDILRSYGLLRNEKIELEHSGRSSQLDDELRDLIAEITESTRALPAPLPEATS